MNNVEPFQHLIVDKPLVHLDVVDSTNLYAKKLADQGSEEGTIVQADLQTLGRGRLGRVWESPAGKGLWFSLILRPRINPQYGAQVTLLAAVAVVNTIKVATGLQASIKWPNDIYYEGKKLCGILSEMELDDVGIGYAIVGIGINVNLDKGDYSDETSAIATSLLIETGKKWNRSDLIRAFRNEFEKLYKSWLKCGFENVREMWLANNCTIGKFVKVKDDDKVIFEGTAKAINDYGSLLVERADGTVEEFDFGEISIRF